MIDRGENSNLACLELVWQLVCEKEAICLTGNHEHYVLAWLHRDPWNAMIINGGMVAIRPLILFCPLDTPVDGLIDANADGTIMKIDQLCQNMPLPCRNRALYFRSCGCGSDHA